MKSFQSLAFSSALVILITACSGEEQKESINVEDRITGGTVGAPSTSMEVTGQFKSAHETDVFFYPQIDSYNSANYLGRNSDLCTSSFNDHYYETDNTLVFGNPNLPDSDFVQAAQWIERNLDNALNTMGLTKESYYQARGGLRLEALNRLRNELWQLDAAETYGTFTIPANSQNLTEDRHIRSYNMVIEAKDKDVIDSLILEPTSGYSDEKQIVVEDKIYVCIHENESPWGWGEGHSLGINVGAASLYVPNELDQIITHELIHTFQYAIAGYIDWLPLPRWFSEGQAVYLSGMKVADKSEHSEYDPTSVVRFYDEYGDPSEAYKHYGLAYQYLVEANGHDCIIEMMRNVKQRHDFNGWDWSMPEEQKYVLSFDSRIKDIDGDNLSVEYFRVNYQSIMNDYANM